MLPESGSLLGTGPLMPQSFAAKLRILSTVGRGGGLGKERMWGEIITVPFYRGPYRGGMTGLL